MKSCGWGKYPCVESEVSSPPSSGHVLDEISRVTDGALIARGLGRSYGDSSLSPNMLSTRLLDHFLDFDESSGVLRCSAGVSLADILAVFVPRGWFLPVTPGTKYVTVGGAVASDVHGKNHHNDGCFSAHVSSLLVATAAKGVIECSRDTYPELFHATCGGMGLTGIILEVSFSMMPIRSAYIEETVIKSQNLKQTLELFKQHKDAAYSVAWIDCMSTGESLGRSLIMLGEHAEDGDLTAAGKSRLAVPFDMPGMLLNSVTIRAFNSLYYNRMFGEVTRQRSHFDSFFYPLDGISDWNRLYGKNGFAQYQFVLPLSAGVEGMAEVLKRIADSKRGSFLAVLKTFGSANDNHLSFPIEGHTLALDFKIEPGIFEMLDELDVLVRECGGRVYLTKDARMSEEMFKSSYDRWEEFMVVRTAYGADAVFNSMQSRRLGI